jgi:dihydroxy-acid dehydratase
VKQAIRAAGGVPFEIRTAAPSDFVTGAGARGAYMLAARDLVTNDIEVAVEGAQLDGMVCLTSCDKTVPGQLMAAARLNVPTILVPCGYQASGEYKGQHVDIEEVFIHSMHAMLGSTPVDDVVGMSRCAIRSPGVCSGLGTANTMHIACEALGMALPGSAPVRALSPKMFADARAAGARIVQMVCDDLTPRRILTPAAFANAVRAVLSIGGSLNAVKHLQAVATEAGTDVDVYGLFERLGPQTPVLAGVRPIGDRFIEEFEDAGGCRALMKQLAPLLAGDALTVTGRSLADNLRDVAVGDAEVIRPHRSPRRPAAGHRAAARATSRPRRRSSRTGIGERQDAALHGPAFCFDTSDAALAALKSGGIRPGHVVVMRGAGACGRPGNGRRRRRVSCSANRRARASGDQGRDAYRRAPVGASCARASWSPRSPPKRRWAARSRWCRTATPSPSTSTRGASTSR